ncbi:MAG: hypothetical protein L6R00_10555, partial [Phycisphaerae bacterium]|nr:hypothetical protein [Phycisphaerae bacterium]
YDLQCAVKAGPSAAICSAVITHLHVLEVRSAGSLVKLEPIQRCSVKKSIEIQRDYMNIVKRKGKLERLK